MTFGGYAGNILSLTTGFQTAPSNLGYNRGIGLVDAFGNYTNIYNGPSWYGTATGKTNPRGVVTDGTNGFWGCGNGYGSLYFNYATQEGPDVFQNINATSFVRIQNNQVLASVKSGDIATGAANLYPAGIYGFKNFFNQSVAYPVGLSYLNLIIPANSAYQNVQGFDMNPAGNVCYVADSKLGVQKYINTGSSWKLAYNIYVPGYSSLTNGILAATPVNTVSAGIFCVAVDWTGANPVIYATTEDDTLYGNRVIKINDTNLVTSGANLTNTSIITTLVAPPKYGQGTNMITNVVFKSVTFTPDVRPRITSNPANWSAVTGDNVNFSVAANSAYTIGYQWLSNGVTIDGATAATLPLTGVSSSASISCVVSNIYGAVTSSVAALTVNSSAVAPTLTAVNVTNFLGSTFSIPVTASGTDPKTYQWYFGGSALADGAAVSADGASYAGTATSTLTISNALAAEAGAYTLVVNNAGGTFSNIAANVSLVLAPPVFITTPVSTSTFTNGFASLSNSVFGLNVTYKWYTSKSSTVISNAVAVVDNTTGAGDVTGSGTSSLNFNSAGFADTSNYFVVAANASGSITSSIATFSVIARPNPGVVNYAFAGSNYVQNFDSMPLNAGGSADAANPALVNVEPLAIALLNNDGASNAANVKYSIPSIVDFSFPALGQGAIGGLGLSNGMSGWYGYAASLMQFGATYGDQTAGGIIDLGKNYLGDGSPLVGVTNRALGLITSTKTGTVAFGVKLINKTGSTLNYLNVGFTGELWRNNGNAQSLVFNYATDAAGTNSVFDINALTLNAVPSMTVSFPTNVTTILDGTLPANQLKLNASVLPIANGWSNNTALWLVWQSSYASGGSQELAIDNLKVSAQQSATFPTITRSGSNVIISWPTWFSGTLQSSPSVSPTAWSDVGVTPTVVGTLNTVTLAIGSDALYFRLH